MLGPLIPYTKTVFCVLCCCCRNGVKSHISRSLKGAALKKGGADL